MFLRFFTSLFLVFVFSIANGNDALNRFKIEQGQLNQSYQQQINALKETVANLQHQLSQSHQNNEPFKNVVLSSAKVPIDKKNQKKINQDYRDARSLILSGQYKLAIEALSNYIKLNPKADNTADSYFWLANSYIANNQFDDGSKKYLLFITKYPKHHKIPKALYHLGLAQFELGHPEKSILLFKSILRRFPQHRVISKVKESLRRLESSKIVSATKTK